ncbi:MAG: carboxysome shell carbonic anhydrase [Planktomarina sp.]
MTVQRTQSWAKTAWRAGQVPSASNRTMTNLRSAPAAASAQTMRLASAGLSSAGGHPFAEPAAATDLARREQEIESAFARLSDVLQSLAPQQFEADFAAKAVSALGMIGVKAEECWFQADWKKPLDMSEIHARCVSRMFARLAQTGSEAVRYMDKDGESVETLIRRWGFHGVDIVTCADGRLAGMLGSVLRIPLQIVTKRRSYAGSMFDLGTAIGDWEEVELGRWRTATPNDASEDTKYLKIGVYHFSSVDPSCQGCAAHGSNDTKAVSALHERLVQFQGSIEGRHNAGDKVALLMVGLDTDTDAIRVHVPDASGAMHADRYVDTAALHGETKSLPRDTAKEHVRAAVAACAGVDGEDEATQGMRWFCGYLLKNNIAQVEAILTQYGGKGYPVAGHAERMIIIGDSVDDVQLRNIAFQAQMGSVEEGEVDLAVGIKILGKLLAADGLSVPVLVVRGFDDDLPGDEEVAASAARRMRNAVMGKEGAAPIVVEAAVRSRTSGEIKFLSAGNDLFTGSGCGCGSAH